MQNVPTELQQALYQLFAALDQNEDGFVSRSDVHQLMQTGNPADATTASLILACFDRNPSVPLLSFEQFVQLIALPSGPTF